MNTIFKQNGGTCTLFACLNSLEQTKQLPLHSEEVYDFIKENNLEMSDGLKPIKLFNKLKLREFAGHKLTSFEVLYNTGLLSSMIYNKQKTLDKIKQTIKEGKKGVLFGLYDSPDGFPLDKAYFLKDRAISKTGGHLVYVAGVMKDKKTHKTVFRVENSWGEKWGDKGFFYIEEKDLFYQVGNVYALEWRATS